MAPIAWRPSHKSSSRLMPGKRFGNEKDESFRSSIETVYHTFDGIDLYGRRESRSPALLYCKKNHSFSDVNKRISTGIFVWFLDKNRMLYRNDDSKRIANNALVALTLMIA